MPEAAHFGGGFQEDVQRAGGFDAAVFEEDDVVGAAESGGTVGDGEDSRQ